MSAIETATPEAVRHRRRWTLDHFVIPMCAIAVVISCVSSLLTWHSFNVYRHNLQCDRAARVDATRATFLGLLDLAQPTPTDPESVAVRLRYVDLVERTQPPIKVKDC